MGKNILLVIIGLILGSFHRSSDKEEEIKDLRSLSIDLISRQNLMLLEMLRKNRFNDAIVMQEKKIAYSITLKDSFYNQRSTKTWKDAFTQMIELYKRKYPENKLKLYEKNANNKEL